MVLVGVAIGWAAGIFLTIIPLVAISVTLLREIPFAETLKANKIVELNLNTKILTSRLLLHFVFVIVLIAATIVLFIVDDDSGFCKGIACGFIAGSLTMILDQAAWFNPSGKSAKSAEHAWKLAGDVTNDLPILFRIGKLDQDNSVKFLHKNLIYNDILEHKVSDWMLFPADDVISMAAYEATVTSPMWRGGTMPTTTQGVQETKKEWLMVLFGRGMG